jgi:UBX domain-containing protein 1
VIQLTRGSSCNASKRVTLERSGCCDPFKKAVPSEDAAAAVLSKRLFTDCQVACAQVARFNLSHTVGDVRRFIRASRPDAPPAFRLATAFPPAQLTDDGATIASAGLANAVIIQKL